MSISKRAFRALKHAFPPGTKYVCKQSSRGEGLSLARSLCTPRQALHSKNLAIPTCRRGWYQAPGIWCGTSAQPERHFTKRHVCRPLTILGATLRTLGSSRATPGIALTTQATRKPSSWRNSRRSSRNWWEAAKRGIISAQTIRAFYFWGAAVPASHDLHVPQERRYDIQRSKAAINGGVE